MAKKRHNPPIYDEPIEEKVADVPTVFTKTEDTKLEDNSVNVPTIPSEETLKAVTPVRTPFESFLYYTSRAILFAVGGAVFYGVFSSAQVVGDAGIKNEQINQEFRKAYRDATTKYADKDSDGTLSLEELNSFDKAFLASQGISASGRVNLKYGPMPYYKNSIEQVSKETVTEWLKNYKPE